MRVVHIFHALSLYDATHAKAKASNAKPSSRSKIAPTTTLQRRPTTTSSNKTLNSANKTTNSNAINSSAKSTSSSSSSVKHKAGGSSSSTSMTTLTTTTASLTEPIPSTNVSPVNAPYLQKKEPGFCVRCSPKNAVAVTLLNVGAHAHYRHIGGALHVKTKRLSWQLSCIAVLFLFFVIVCMRVRIGFYAHIYTHRTPFDHTP